MAASSRREAALQLSEEVLDDIELNRLGAPEVLKKTSRLARLLDDTSATEWLAFEMHGYPTPLSKSAATAASRSNRLAPDEDGKAQWWTISISHIQANIESRRLQLGAAQDRPVSISSSNPSQYVMAPQGNALERGQLASFIATQEALLGKILGALHGYVAERAIELRFGAAVESSFTVVRNSVDARIATLVPTAAVKFSAAFENASSGNSEHWANAASACRRLLKELADVLRPAGEPVNGRAMTDSKYINRLIDWIANHGARGTMQDVVTADLEDFGKRIDALDEAGHKGAHAEVTHYEASRFITGTYLLVGDILRLWKEDAGSAPVRDEAQA